MPVKIVGIMLCRNEDWILETSMRAALRWVDHLVVLDHSSNDKSLSIMTGISNEEKDRVSIMSEPHVVGFWDEMEIRQKTLGTARYLDATHVAVIDADEILTSNLVPCVREWFKSLAPGQILDVPMIPMWRSLGQYRDDSSIWSRSKITLGFRDTKNLFWQPKSDGYQHHARPPQGCLPNRMSPLEGKAGGGVMHLQFANWRRLVAKHVLYRMADHLRWPNRDSIEKLNWKYDQALDERMIRFSECQEAWWEGIVKNKIKLDGVPWQESAVRDLLEANGREVFNGIDLKGF